MYLTLQNPTTRIQNALKIGWSAILFIALWLGISLSVWAQPLYDFTAVSGTFTALTGGTTAGINDDDVISAALPIGFTFVYDGVARTQFRASSNGFMTFNSTSTASSLTNNMSAAGAANRPILAPLWDDLDGRAAGGSTASYLTQGVVGSRIFTMEWLNWEWRFNSTDPVISFQVKLYEATGVIEYVYRQEAGAVAAGSASIGLTTATGTGANSYLSLNSSGTAPTVSSTVETTTIVAKPATGQIYRWSPNFTPVRTLTPANGATGVSLTSNLTIGFAYPATPPTIGTGTIELRKTTGSALVESFVLPSTRITVAGNVVTIDPTVILDCNTEYYVTAPATAIGNASFTGITTTTAWSFTTTAPVGVAAGVPTTVLDQNFATATGSTPPTGWINNGIAGAVVEVWRFDNPGNRAATGFTAPFAIFDSDSYGNNGSAENVALETPVFDASAGGVYTLSFKHYFNDGSGGGYNVEVFNGASWVSVQSGTAEVGSLTAPVTESINITAASGANAAAKVRFRWTGNWSWYWIVDDVKITSSTTELPLTATFSPTNGSTNIIQTTNLVLDFPYPVSAGTGNIEIVNTAGGAVLETIPVGDARVNYGTVGQVTINPTSNLPVGATVAVRFPTGAFQSCNNIDVAGIINTTDWSFTIGDPCATLTVNAGPNQINLPSGSNVTFAGSASGGTGPYSYAWTPAAGLSNATVLNPTFIGLTTTSTFTLTTTDTATGCVKSDGVVITIAPAGGGGGGGGAPSSVTAPSLRLTSTGATTMTLNWTGGSASEYTIFRRGGNSNTFVRVAQVGGGVSTFLDALLIPNTRYSYYVQAVRGSSTANSNTVSDFTYPSAPIIASFQNACTGTGAQLTVRGSTGVYNVYSAQTGGTTLVRGDSTGIITTPAFTTATATFYISAIGTRYESTPRVAVSVITRPLPTAIMLGAESQESCTDSLTIMAQAVDGATYTWYSSDTPVTTTSVPMYTVNRSGVYSVLVNTDGCVARSNMIRVGVNRISPAQITGSSTREFCEVGTLQAVQTAGASYEWQRNNAVVGTGSDLEVTQSGTYTVSVTSPLGCILTSTPVSVTVINVPQLDLQTSTSDFCEGAEGVELSVNSVSGASYEWLRNGRKIRTTSTPSLQVNIGAEYRVRVVLNGTCSRVSDPITVIRNAAPAASVRVYGDSIKVVYVGNIAITNVTWTKDDAPFSATTQAFVPTESGLYTATVTYETGCQVVASGIQYIKPPEPPVIVGEEEVEALGFMLFPNPTASKVNVAFGDAFKGEITLTLTDAIGRTIQIVKVKATENATLDLSTLANGSYMLTIASDNKVVTRKIIRE